MRASGVAGLGWTEVLLVAALHVLPFAVRPALIGGDEPHYALMAHSLAADGDLVLEDDYLEVEAGSLAAGRKRAGEALERHVRDFGGRKIFSHPLGLPLLVVPLLRLQLALWPGAPPDLLLGLTSLALTFAALLEGLRLLEAWLGDRRRARLLTFAVYFATPLWYYSRTFFTEPYVWSLCVLGLGAMRRGRWWLASGLLGAAFLVKETAILVLVPVMLFTWRRFGVRETLRLALFPMLFFAAYCLKNRLVYGEWLVTFQAFQMGPPLAGVRGLLLDPRHGLIPFAPISVLAFGRWLRPRRAPGALASPEMAALLCFLGYFAVTALWVDWRGGASYGPRLLVPALPALALPLGRSPGAGRPSRWYRVPLYLLVGIGFTLQWCAAMDPFAALWSPTVGQLVARRPLLAAIGSVVGAALMLGISRVPLGPLGIRDPGRASGHGLR